MEPFPLFEKMLTEGVRKNADAIPVDEVRKWLERINLSFFRNDDVICALDEDVILELLSADQAQDPEISKIFLATAQRLTAEVAEFLRDDEGKHQISVISIGQQKWNAPQGNPDKVFKKARSKGLYPSCDTAYREFAALLERERNNPDIRHLSPEKFFRAYHDLPVDDEEYSYVCCEAPNFSDYPNANSMLKPECLVEFKHILLDALKGLRLLHQSGLVHNDFMPANILIAKDSNGEKYGILSDFELLGKMNSRTGGLSNGASYCRDSIYWKYGQKYLSHLHTGKDMFAVGMTMLEILCASINAGFDRLKDSLKSFFKEYGRGDLTAGEIEIELHEALLRYSFSDEHRQWLHIIAQTLVKNPTYRTDVDAVIDLLEESTTPLAEDLEV